MQRRSQLRHGANGLPRLALPRPTADSRWFEMASATGSASNRPFTGPRRGTRARCARSPWRPARPGRLRTRDLQRPRGPPDDLARLVQKVFGVGGALVEGSDDPLAHGATLSRPRGSPAAPPWASHAARGQPEVLQDEAGRAGGSEDAGDPEHPHGHRVGGHHHLGHGAPEAPVHRVLLDGDQGPGLQGRGDHGLPVEGAHGGHVQHSGLDPAAGQPRRPRGPAPPSRRWR